MSNYKRNIELLVTRTIGDRDSAGNFVATTTLEDGTVPTQTLTIRDLNVEFVVERDRSAGPNTLEARVYGLSENKRFLLRESPWTEVELRVGYGPRETAKLFTIFKGNLRTSSTTREGTEVVTKIEAATGERAQPVWLSRSYRKGTQLRTVVGDLVDAMGIDRGNLDSFFPAQPTTASLETNSIPLQIKNGVTLHGHASDQLARLLNSRGIEWSIQDNRLQLIKFGEAVARPGAVPLLAPDTGLIGIPAIDNKGIMTCECEIVPLIFPGVEIDVRSKYLGAKSSEQATTSRYKVIKAVYKGSLFGSDFKIMIDGKRIKS